MVISRLKLSIIIIGVLAFIGMLALYFFGNPLDSNIFPKCPFYVATNIYCPGCGSQRAAHQLLNGNVIEAVRHNYLIALLFLVLLYQAFIFIMNNVLNRGTANLLHKSKVTLSILIVIILFWILRNVNLFPFTELAP